MMEYCRACSAELKQVFVDLGMSPLANAYIPPERADSIETFYPLRPLVCSHCFLVQLPAFETPEDLFSNYLYFSSFSSSWLDHCEKYARQMIERLRLGKKSQVVEIASNDGYLLQFFKSANIPVLGIEPAENIAREAEKQGIHTLVRFFGTLMAEELVREGNAADLLIANNVLAHVPNLCDFVQGLRIAVKDHGTITIEFPHILNLIEQTQFDTIYHEHFSYFSLTTIDRLFRENHLSIYDVDEIPTHGGSLRIYACRDENKTPITDRATKMLQREDVAGITSMAYYSDFAERVREVKRALLELLIDLKRQSRVVVGYGAPAKATTLLNYCGVRTDFLDYTADRSPHKQHHLVPGVRIPIEPPERIAETRPDYVFILPWNLKDEIMDQLAYIRDWGARFIVAIPEPSVHP